MDIRTDRTGVLVEQLTDAAALSRTRCDGMTDEEYLWEPVGGMWSIRQRGRSTTSAAFGPGSWVLDREFGDPFAAAPLSTIAWRVCHLLSGFVGRYEWTFGAKQIDPADVVDFSPSSTDTFAALWDVIDRWSTAVDALSSEELDQTGFGQYPWGIDATIPFVGIVRWVNREFIHHMAEVALMRDLYNRRNDL